MYTLIVGQSCAGKTTLANSFAKQEDCQVYREPITSVFPRFMKEMAAYALRNQQEFMQLIFENELKVANSSSPLIFQESGLIVCHEIYNTFLKDHSYLSTSEFEVLRERYVRDSSRCRPPDRVICLRAQTTLLKQRALARDGVIIYDFEALEPYWTKLLAKFESMDIPVVVVNTDT